MSNDSVEKKKKIFFIRHPEGALENVSKFLGQRDYEVYLSSDLKEAFTEILRIQPEVVFICIDHPNEKITSIPKLLLQSLMLTVIPYVHGTAMVSIRQIQASSFEYKLFPPNTGPSTLRLLNKILKDQARGSDLENKKKSGLGKVINTGKNPSRDSKIHKIGGSQLNKNWNFKKGGKSDPQREEMITGGKEDRLGTVSKLDGSSVQQSSIPQIKKTSSVQTKLGSNDSLSGFEKTTEEILLHISSVSGPEVEFNQIQVVSNVTCFEINSSKFSGYLVTAFAGEKKIGPDFLQFVKLRLKEFLNLQGEDIDPSEKMEIQIVNVEFQAWAVEQAEFLKKSVHDGSEIAMAFFPVEQDRISILPSAGKEMMKASIDFIDEQKSMNFDLYIYFAVNQRYILYTPKGGKLGRNQKTRLKKRGVEDFHFHKNDIHKFKTYQAEKLLNDRISEFHAKSLKSVKEISG